MLFLLVTGAGGPLVGISFVPQRILLMPQYKLDYQRPLWRKIPALTPLQQYYGKEVQKTHLISSMKPYGLSGLFRCWSSYRPSLLVSEEVFCCLLLIAPEILLWPPLSYFNVSSARIWFLLSTSLRYDFMLLLGKHPNFYFVSLLRQNKTGELGFALAEAITLCTLWSSVEQTASCKVLNETLHIVQPKAASSLDGFATSCTTEPYSAGTKASLLILGEVFSAGEAQSTIKLI